jgi:hypothetical protein
VPCQEHAPTRPILSTTNATLLGTDPFSISFRIKTITEEQIKLADRKYIASVYFHTLFLYATSKAKNYSMKQGETEKDITDYLREIFAGSYSEFLLNFGTEQLMASLEL